MQKLLKLSLPILVWPGAVFFLHLVATYTGLYWQYRWLDTPFHLAGGMSIALATYFWLRNIAKPNWILWLLLITVTGTVAVLWEFAEYIGDEWFHVYMQIGLFDTLKDLYCGLVGAIIVTLVVIIKSLKKP